VNVRAIAIAVLWGLTLVPAPAFMAFAAAQAAEPGRTPLPAIAIEKPGQCVEPKDVMRRDHMKLLKHQRDKTLHQGIRSKPHSLNECISCHASQKTGSVTGAGGFCQSCHDYAAVKLDCWDCHQPKPGQKTAAGVKP
jgi:cytochrome c553